MRAITLHQPYATLIALGRKRYETRSWAPPQWLLGQRIAIHAAKNTSREVRDNILLELDKSDLPIPYGVVVATAILVNAGQVDRYGRQGDIGVRWAIQGRIANGKRICVNQWVPPEDQKHGDFTVDRWLWELADIELVDPPVEVRGHPGILDLVGINSRRP